MPENELGRPTPELGTIEQVDMRLIWPHEAHDFTPWLANRLDLLGDPLGMELELVQREANIGNIGGFSVDILARKPATVEAILSGEGAAREEWAGVRTLTGQERYAFR